MASESSPSVFHVPAARTGTNRRHVAVMIAVAVAGLAFVMIAGGILNGAAARTDFTIRNLPPSRWHPFGTDWMGRDVLVRTFAGLSTSMTIGLLAAALSSVIALALAVLSALGGRRIDAAVTWSVDLVLGLPQIILLMLVSYALGRGALGVSVAVALTHWPSLTRVLRAELGQVLERPFIGCARALGVSAPRIALTHLMAHLLPQFLVGAVLLFPHAILHEASITFLGFGLPSEQPAIGAILSESMSHLSAGAWWLAVFPGVALLGVVLLFDAIGAGLRRLTARDGAQL